VARQTQDDAVDTLASTLLCVADEIDAGRAVEGEVLRHYAGQLREAVGLPPKPPKGNGWATARRLEAAVLRLAEGVRHAMTCGDPHDCEACRAIKEEADAVLGRRPVDG
jgi:hypothetical protein